MQQTRDDEDTARRGERYPRVSTLRPSFAASAPLIVPPGVRNAAAADSGVGELEPAAAAVAAVSAAGAAVAGVGADGDDGGDVAAPVAAAAAAATAGDVAPTKRMLAERSIGDGALARFLAMVAS